MKRPGTGTLSELARDLGRTTLGEPAISLDSAGQIEKARR